MNVGEPRGGDGVLYPLRRERERLRLGDLHGPTIAARMVLNGLWYSILYIVDRPTELICISNIYLSTDKYKRHSRAIC